MMQEPFRLDHDMSRRLMRIDLAGFWTAVTMADFRRAVAAALQRATTRGATPGTGHILIDKTRFAVQDKVIAEELGTLLSRYGQFANRTAVIVSSSAMQRLQAQRLVGDRGRLCDDEAAALEWLFAEG